MFANHQTFVVRHITALIKNAKAPNATESAPDGTNFFQLVYFQFAYNGTTAILNAFANYCSLKSCAKMRTKLTRHMHNFYLDSQGRLYYCMNCLDKKVDSPDT